MGKPFMPWQAMVSNVAGEYDPRTGVPSYREVRLKVPRQSGKTLLVLVVEVDRCLYWGQQQRLIYAAQDRNNSRQKWEEQADFLVASPLGSAFDVRRQTGVERIIVPATGSSIGITASGETSGHGFYLDVAVIDEAWAQRDERLVQAFRPAMLTRPMAQTWIISTEGTDESVFFNERVEDGRARVELQHTDPAARRGIAFFEWSAADDDDPDDPDTWWRCMPALGHTISEDTVRDDKDGIDAADFARAYLNRRAPKGLTVLSAEAWQAARRPDSQLRGCPVFAVDTTPERSWTSIGAAGWTDDRVTHLEIVEHRPGVDWAPRRLAELAGRWRTGPVVLDPAGPAGSMVEELAALGVPTLTVNAREYTAACGQFYDALYTTPARLCHIDQPVLSVAVAAARKRPLGDAWAWTRKTGGDVSPLVAVTLARYALARGGDSEFKIY